MLSELTKEKWDRRISLLMNRQRELNDYEFGFLFDIETKRSLKLDLSTQEAIKLTELYNKYGG
jgi:hypothetical protein